MYRYKVTTERYVNDGFDGYQDYYVNAEHCSVAAQMVEDAETNVDVNVFVVDVERVGDV